MRRELMALVVAAAILVAVLAAFMFIEAGGPTAPTTRTADQNRAINTPHETQPPPNGQGG